MLRCLGSGVFPSPEQLWVFSPGVLLKPWAASWRPFFYFEDERGADSAAKLPTRDKAQRIAANIAKLPER